MLVSGPVARLSSQVLRAKLGPQALDQPQDYQVNSWLGQQEDRNICVIYQVRQATLKHSQTPPCDSVTRVWAQRGAGCCSYPQQFLLLLTAIFLYTFLLLPTANFTSIHSKCYSQPQLILLLAKAICNYLLLLSSVIFTLIDSKFFCTFFTSIHS